MRSAITRDRYDAVLFDLDGVITDTANMHAACWKQMFDEYLQKRATERGEAFRPFDLATDYRLYVDGKPRFDGVRDFLTSRGIQLPEGSPDDPPQAETVGGLGNRKNDLVNKVIARGGVEPYEGSVKLIHQLRHQGFKIAVVTSSQNCEAVLKAAKLDAFFECASRWQHDPCATPGREARPGYVLDRRQSCSGLSRHGRLSSRMPSLASRPGARELRACDRRRAQGECRGASAPWRASGGERSGRTG